MDAEIAAGTDSKGEVIRVPVYRAMTLAALGGHLAREQDESLRVRLLAEFLEEYRHEPPEEREWLLKESPPSTGVRGWDAFLAALAEHLTQRDGYPPPSWVFDDLRLDGGGWALDGGLPSRRADAIAVAPPVFRRRRVYVDLRDLARDGVPP